MRHLDCHDALGNAYAQSHCYQRSHRLQLNLSKEKRLICDYTYGPDSNH
jgi:hypothetical protein